MINEFKKKLASILIISMIFAMTACSKPYKEDEVLCKYPELNCLYYTKDKYEKYKYNDYIFDDVSNGMYKKSTPNLADYKLGTGLLDYDIPAYVQARMDYAIKTDLIKKYEVKVDEICASVHDDYFEQKNSYVYFYDLNTKKSTLLYDGPVTNIAYDDEIPSISFDIDSNDGQLADEVSGRRIMLSDIIAANTTIDGYMRVMLGTGKERQQYFMDKRVDNNELYKASTPSNIN